MSEGMGSRQLKDPRAMGLEELRIRADEGRMILDGVELRVEFLDHYPPIRKLYAEATMAAEARIAFYEQLIREKEQNGGN